MKTIKLQDFAIGNHLPLVLLAGPCALESRDHALRLSAALKEITARLGLPLIYKSSFDKANRTSVSGKRGLGLHESLRVFEEVKRETGLPIVTDVHEVGHCAPVAEVVDVLQIPAFLCRQTDLLLAAGRTGKIVNVKKGQFLAPWDMQPVLAKVTSTGNERVMACERGTSFGYNTLVSDFRGLPTMARFGYPVVFDATHSVQQPGGQGNASGGQREFIPALARAAVSVGVAALFMEVHDDPAQAFSDGPNQVPLEAVEDLLASLMEFDALAKANPINL